MANELYDCVVFVKGLMDKISIVKKTRLGPPDSIVTECEVAVIVDTLRHHQLGTYTHEQRHYLILRGYAPMGTEPEIAEEKLLKLWNLMIDVLNANVSLGGTATHSNLERGRPGYKTVAGVKCRTLEARLMVSLAQAEAYKA